MKGETILFQILQDELVRQYWLTPGTGSHLFIFLPILNWELKWLWVVLCLARYIWYERVTGGPPKYLQTTPPWARYIRTNPSSLDRQTCAPFFSGSVVHLARNIRRGAQGRATPSLQTLTTAHCLGRKHLAQKSAREKIVNSSQERK